MKKFILKLLFVFLLTTYYLLHASFPIHAQTVSSANSIGAQPAQQAQNVNQYIAPNITSDVKPSLHSWVPAVLNEMMAATVCVLGGVDPVTKTDNCLGVTKDGKFGYVGGQGLTKTMASTIDSIYQTGFPVSSITYAHYLTSNFGIVKPAYAAFGCPPPPPAGQFPNQNALSGFCGLSPLISIWSVIRNLAYLLIVIAFIIIGLAIMLRVKIDPRTVMTIENQLPKLVVGLVLVTFSFAIAGVMVDGMKIMDGLIFNVYQSIPDDTANGITFNRGVQWDRDFQKSSPWDAVSVVVPPSTKLVPLDTASFSLGPLNIHIPLLDAIPQVIKDVINVIPGFGQIFSALDSTAPAQTLSYQQGFGDGIVEIANASAFSFGAVLNTFFKLNTPNSAPSSTAYGGFGGLIAGPLVFLFNDFKNSTPIGAIVDIASSVLSTSLSFKIGQLLASAPIGISAEGFSFGGGATFPLGLILGPVIGVGTYFAAFNFIDTALRNLAAPVVVWFIVYVAIFLAMARLFFSLIFAWATILFNVVVGPIIIVFGLIPGIKSGGFTGWIKTLAANLMAFPITIGVLLLGSALVQAVSGNGNFFVPPLVGGGILPVGLLMAINVLFAASNGPQIAKDLFEEKDNKNTGAFAQASGQSLGAVYKAGKATVYGFGKTPTPGQRGGAMGAFNVLG